MRDSIGCIHFSVGEEIPERPGMMEDFVKSEAVNILDEICKNLVESGIMTIDGYRDFILAHMEDRMEHYSR